MHGGNTHKEKRVVDIGLINGVRVDGKEKKEDAEVSNQKVVVSTRLLQESFEEQPNRFQNYGLAMCKKDWEELDETNKDLKEVIEDHKDHIHFSVKEEKK